MGYPPRRRRALLNEEREPQERDKKNRLEALLCLERHRKKTQEKKNTEGTPQLTNQILDSLEGYLDNIAAAATQTAANGVSLAELTTSLAILVDTIARQKLEIKRLSEQFSALKKKGASGTSGATVPGGNNPLCKHCEAVGQTAPHRRKACYFDPRKNKDI